VGDFIFFFYQEFAWVSVAFLFRLNANPVCLTPHGVGLFFRSFIQRLCETNQDKNSRGVCETGFASVLYCIWDRCWL